jgi:hypothetical protein
MIYGGRLRLPWTLKLRMGRAAGGLRRRSNPSPLPIPERLFRSYSVQRQRSV